MSGEHGDETEGETAEEIEHHIGVMLIFHQCRTLVHEGGEGGETAAETKIALTKLKESIKDE